MQEFLKPALENAVQHEYKKIGKDIKTHAQALGIKTMRNENQNRVARNNEKKKKQELEDKKIDELEKVMKNVEKQIEKLKEIIAVGCGTIVKDEEFKTMVLLQIHT